MRTKLELIAAGLALAAALGGVFYVRSLKAELAAANQAAGTAQASLAVMQRAQIANAAALESRERERGALAAETEELKRKLEELYQNDEPCQLWSAFDMPDSVYDRLRR